MAYKIKGTKEQILRNILNQAVHRCTNSNNKRYKNYGGRGIGVCAEWLSDRVLFLKWAFANGWVKGLQLDRIDNNKGYSPDNCRFVTAKVNANNRSDTRIIEYLGEKKPLGIWCAELNLNHTAVLMRLHTGKFSIEEAFTRPIRKQRTRQQLLNLKQ